MSKDIESMCEDIAKILGRFNEIVEIDKIVKEDPDKKPTTEPKPEEHAVNLEGLRYCIVRGRHSGVYAGYVKERRGTEATLLLARRLWFWSGAASLSELARYGVANPEKCKFPCTVNEIEITDVVEVIPATEIAFESIEGVPEWKARR
jgi:hypothetical protein